LKLNYGQIEYDGVPPSQLSMSPVTQEEAAI
jgi:hypothetical protein